MKLYTFIFLFLGCHILFSCRAQKSPSTSLLQSDIASKEHKIDSLLHLYAKYGQLNGAVLVADKGEVLYKNAFGSANFEWNIPNETDTKFRLASVTKQFTSMLIMQMVAKDLVNLDSTISTYLPNYPKETGEKVTIHQLLSHTSGIPNYTSFRNYRETMVKRKTSEELLQLFADSTLKFTPGERFSYSNSGYTILGVIIEKISGQTYGKVLEKQILEPLGMRNTGYDQNSTVLNKRANSYYKNGESHLNSHFIDMSIAFSAGGMYSTVEDLFLWDQALYTDKLLDKEHRDLLFEEHIPAWGASYAYGWMIGSKRIGNTDERIAGIDHDGTLNGFDTYILRIPSTSSSVILLSNVGGAPLRDMARGILGILNEKSYEFPKQSLAKVISQIIEDEGVNKAQVSFENLKESKEYYLDENELNMAGYSFIQSNKLKAAAFLFNENIKAHPHSSNAYDSFGEVQLMLKDTADAIKYYNKSVEYNPRNDHGKKVLKDLGLAEDVIENLTLDLFEKHEEFQNEIFHFPLRFAPEIDYEGREDARFPAGWRQTDSDDFWSYVFAWHVNREAPQTIEQIESNLQLYFDGLMKVVNKEKEKVLPKTKTNFNQKENQNGIQHMTGSIDIYDAFITTEPLTLHVQVEQHAWDQGKSIIVFRFSPKSFDHAIWKKLKELELRKS